MNNTVKSIAQYLLSLSILYLLWVVVVVGFSIPKYVLPHPNIVITTLFTETSLFTNALGYTLFNTVLGGSLGIFLGILLAMLLAYFNPLRWIAEPYLIIFQSFPRESLFPLFIVWFGFGITTKVINAFLLSFFPVAVIVLNALINVDQSYIQLIRSWYGSKRDEFFYCRLPYAIPQIISAVKIGLPFALIGAVLGEFMGGAQGLGYIIISSGAQFRVDRIFTAILILVLIGVSFLALVQMMQKFFLQRYFFMR